MRPLMHNVGPMIFSISVRQRKTNRRLYPAWPVSKGAFKPDIVAHGGNFASDVRQEGQWQPHMRGLGVLSCHHQFQGNTLFKELSGTSFAAPYITHLAGRLLNEYPEMSANMLRAMLVNHASVTQEMTQAFPQEMRESFRNTPATRNREIERDVVGYGIIDEDTLYRSSEYVVVMRCEEQIENNAHQFLSSPFRLLFYVRGEQRVKSASRWLIHLRYVPLGWITPPRGSISGWLKVVH